MKLTLQVTGGSVADFPLHSQLFWGEMVAAAGAGPKPIPHKRLTTQNLAAAIQFCLSEKAQSAAKHMAAKMKTEFGVQDAAGSFHAMLPADAMRCDLIHGEAACWSYKQSGKRLKLSKVAAEILINNSEIRPDQLKRYESKPVAIDNNRWDPFTATTSSLASTGMGMVISASNIVVKPVEAIMETAKARNENGNDEILQTTPESSAVPWQGTFVKAVAGSASGVGGFFHHFSKGMLVDMPLAAAEGLRAVPKLYGSEVPDHGRVTDWKTGAVVACKTFGYSMTHGFADVVNEPLTGAKKEGAVGAVKGVGKGLVNMTTKVSSGTLQHASGIVIDQQLTKRNQVFLDWWHIRVKGS